MIVAILGDTHFGARNDSPVFDRQFKSFYDNVFFPYLTEHKIQHVIQLGDIFDRRKYINFNTLHNVSKYFFDRLQELYITMDVIIGNHDTFYKNTNTINSPNLLLNSYSNINCISKPEEKVYGETSFLFLPWICSDNEQQSFEAIEQTKSQICCGHLEIQGFEMYKGAITDHGIDKKIFEKFDLVLSGHYHHRSTKHNITYCGTPYELTWSDYNDPKGFHVFDTSTRELTFVPNPNVMFVKVHYDDSGKTIEEIVLDDFSHLKDTIVKLIVRNKENPYCFELLIEALEKAGVADIQVVDDHFHMDNEQDKDIVDEVEDTLTILNKYIDSVQIQTNKKQLEQLMQSLYSEALSLE